MQSTRLFILSVSLILLSVFIFGSIILPNTDLCKNNVCAIAMEHEDAETSTDNENITDEFLSFEHDFFVVITQDDLKGTSAFIYPIFSHFPGSPSTPPPEVRG